MNCPSKVVKDRKKMHQKARIVVRITEMDSLVQSASSLYRAFFSSSIPRNGQESA
jgi:hypothetical protein